jgi:hypothetical protein
MHALSQQPVGVLHIQTRTRHLPYCPKGKSNILKAYIYTIKKSAESRSAPFAMIKITSTTNGAKLENCNKAWNYRDFRGYNSRESE